MLRLPPAGPLSLMLNCARNLELKTISKKYCIYLFLLIGIGQTSAQEAQFLDNPISLLRELKVKTISSIEEYANFSYELEHSSKKTSIYYQESFYDYVYTEDSTGVERISDSIYLYLDQLEEHYFNGDELLDSSIYSYSYPDSLESNRSSLIQYFYSAEGHLKRRRTSTYWDETVNSETLYHRQGSRLDSTFHYSNTTQSTFGPRFYDSLQLIEKIRYRYDSLDRKSEKIKYWQQWERLLASYTYPEKGRIISEKPHYRNGRLDDIPDISFVEIEEASRNANGLLESMRISHRFKHENEQWKNGEWVSYRLAYEMN